MTVHCDGPLSTATPRSERLVRAESFVVMLRTNRGAVAWRVDPSEREPDRMTDAQASREFAVDADFAAAKAMG